MIGYGSKDRFKESGLTEAKRAPAEGALVFYFRFQLFGRNGILQL